MPPAVSEEELKLAPFSCWSVGKKACDEALRATPKPPELPRLCLKPPPVRTLKTGARRVPLLGTRMA